MPYLVEGSIGIVVRYACVSNKGYTHETEWNECLSITHEKFQTDGNLNVSFGPICFNK